MEQQVSRQHREDESLLTVAQVAEWLRVRPSTIYAWVASGKIPHVRVGTLIRFDRLGVLRWLGTRREG